MLVYLGMKEMIIALIDIDKNAIKNQWRRKTGLDIVKKPVEKPIAQENKQTVNKDNWTMKQLTKQ